MFGPAGITRMSATECGTLDLLAGARHRGDQLRVVNPSPLLDSRPGTRIAAVVGFASVHLRTSH